MLYSTSVKGHSQIIYLTNNIVDITAELDKYPCLSCAKVIAL